MPVMSAQETSTGKDLKHIADALKSSSKVRSVTLEDEDWNWTADKKKTPLRRSGSVKDLIYRFDGSPPCLGSLKIKRQDSSAQDSGNMTHESREIEKSLVSSEAQEVREAEKKNEDKPDAPESGPFSSLNGEKQHSSPVSEDEPMTPKVRPNPKYQLYLGLQRLQRIQRIQRGPAEGQSCEPRVHGVALVPGRGQLVRKNGWD
ncbi:uncharacterized protein LOC113090190 [Carassius auratus]|uniref:Uncharacterized protein LOC113090190 n=1 Tax=Carassius auratus TaxID=7957 RepID=A0A6P6NSX1_CARAU|nr:uncharacterized protein LOC113090190 [Carassius auratus]XP_026111970.1 uncharacterized protein LOC113090190 [Carassius auratus]XP_026111971.1 uncharacterized protein LOC113090190 [Carassius auratus]